MMPNPFQPRQAVRSNIRDSDRLLRPYLLAKTARDSDRQFRALWAGVEKRVHLRMRRYLSGPAEWEDMEDARAEAILRMTRALTRLRDGDDTPPIRSFDAVVGHIVRNACWKTIQARHPERQALKKDITDAVTELPDFAIWTSPEGATICGPSVWRDGTDSRSVSLGELQDLRRNPNAFLTDRGIDIHSPCSDLSSLLKTIIEHVGVPILVSDLVTIVATLSGLDDEQISIDTSRDSDLPASGAGDAYDEVIYRRSLSLIWTTILELSPTQRSVMLLNCTLFDDGLYTFLEHGVAGMRDIAKALDMTPEEFVKIWNDLPLPNKLIALHLVAVRGTPVSERNVIQFRDDAKRALARRLRRSGWWRDDELPCNSGKASKPSDIAGVLRLS